MKFALLTLDALAIRLPTLIWAPPPNTMPFGLINSTCPLASSRPRMIDAWGPVTRLSVADPADGCTNRTCAPAPIPKLRQSIIARSLVWSTRVTEALVEICASPARTTPPSGSVCASRPVPPS